MFLRHVGYDTFMPTGDVVKALIGAGIIDKQPTSKKARRAVLTAFNQWRAETGRLLCQLSQLLAFSVD